MTTLDTTGTTLEQAKQARLIQAALMASLARDVAQAWPALDVKRLDATWPRWLQVMSVLVNRYRSMASLAASIHYQDVRKTVVGQPLSDHLLRLAGPADPQQLDRAFGFSGPGVLSNDDYADGSGLSITTGTAQRLAIDADRATVIETTKADPVALGWYRVTDDRPCAFCALLAGRGAVYGEHTAGFKAHNACGCSAAPLFDRQQKLPDLSRTADHLYVESTRGVPGAQRLGAFRKAWDAHLAGQAS